MEFTKLVLKNWTDKQAISVQQAFDSIINHITKKDNFFIEHKTILEKNIDKKIDFNFEPDSYL